MHQRLLVSFFLLAYSGAPRGDDAIRWLDNYQEALREARKTLRPIFLEFRCEA